MNAGRDPPILKILKINNIGSFCSEEPHKKLIMTKTSLDYRNTIYFDIH